MGVEGGVRRIRVYGSYSSVATGVAVVLLLVLKGGRRVRCSTLADGIRVALRGVRVEGLGVRG